MGVQRDRTIPASLMVCPEPARWVSLLGGATVAHLIGEAVAYRGFGVCRWAEPLRRGRGGVPHDSLEWVGGAFSDESMIDNGWLML